MKKRKIGTRGIMMITTMSIMIAAVIITAVIGMIGVRTTNNIGIKNYKDTMTDGDTILKLRRRLSQQFRLFLIIIIYRRMTNCPKKKQKNRR